MALIDIGSTKQLFVDDYLIESMTNTRQVMNPAEKVADNPIIQPDRPWEGNHLFGHQVIYDDADQLFKLRYGANQFTMRRADGETVIEGYEGGPPSEISFTCLATSTDGFHWEKPDLGLVEFRGSKKNNILPDSALMGYYFLDGHEEEAARRYKGFKRVGTTRTPGMQFHLFYSPDGMIWTPEEKNPVIDTTPRVGRWGPTEFMGWDPIRQVYAVHMENCLHRNSPIRRRLIGRAESPDLIHWSEPETILLPDEQDPPDLEFYSMDVIPYAGLYVGLLWNFRTNQATHHPQIVFSRDGIRYDRRYREPYLARGPQGSFDSASVFTDSPLVVGDQILIYYTGRNWRSIETLEELEGKGMAHIGLATSPLDGFVSVDGAKRNFSELITRSFAFLGNQLYLNVASARQRAWGADPCEVRVELLRPNHESLPGYGFEDADPITTSGQAQLVSWQGQSDLGELAGGPIKLRFYFKNAKLYSFQFA
jgi:hypothetical protein